MAIRIVISVGLISYSKLTSAVCKLAARPQSTSRVRVGIRPDILAIVLFPDD